MADDRSNEWPLVVFTVGLQLCCGIAIAISTLDVLGAGDLRLIRYFGVAVFPLVVLAVLGSTLHLGRPFTAPRALLNLGRSRLSSEAAITSVLVVLSFLYSGLWLIQGSGPRIGIGIATAIAGIFAVLSSARIYTVPTQPFWDSAWVTCSFSGATLLFAGVSGLLVVDSQRERATNIMVCLTVLGAALMLASASWMIRHLKRVTKVRYSNPCAAPIVKGADWVSFLGFVLLAGVVPLISILVLRSAPAIAANASVLMLFLGLIGVVLGRKCMYTLGTSLSRF